MKANKSIICHISHILLYAKGIHILSNKHTLHGIPLCVVSKIQEKGIDWSYTKAVERLDKGEG